MALPSNRVRHHGSTALPSSVAPAKNQLGEIGQPQLLCAIEQVALSCSLRASEPVHPKERGATEGAVSELSRLCGVYHCQVRVYDKKAGDSAGPLTADETTKTSTNLNRTPVQ